MDEELIIDELFVRKHQKDILEVIPKTNSSLKFEIKAKQFYAASQRVL